MLKLVYPRQKELHLLRSSTPNYQSHNKYHYYNKNNNNKINNNRINNKININLINNNLINNKYRVLEKSIDNSHIGTLLTAK